MIQRPISPTLRFACCALLLLVVGCDRATASRAKDGVVSLSPAATDLVLAMGGADQLVGVSTFDTDPRIGKLPKVGDYENVDWERIEALAPKHMIVQTAVDRLPPGFSDRAAKLGIALHTARIDRFTDVIVEADSIGAEIGRADEARAFWKRLRDQVDAVKTKVAGRPPVKTLLITSDDSLFVAGPQTYLDDLLGFAGGVNALGVDHAGYVKIDREQLASLAPDAIIQLAPGATPAQRAAMDENWKSLAELPAVKSGRILVVTDAWGLMPGSHVGELAERFARHLHPEAY